MDDRSLIQEYLNNIRRHLAPRLKPGIGVSSHFYPATTGGGLLELKLGPAQANVDLVVNGARTIGEVLENVPQRAFGGDLTAFRFSGTNVVIDGDRILLIKGDDDPVHWSDKAALDDLLMALKQPASR